MELNESNIDIFTKELKKVAQIDTLILETKDMMKPLKDRLKQLQTEKKELEKALCPTMEKNDFRQAILPGDIGIVQYKSKQSMVPMTQKTVKDKMELFFKEGPGSQISFNSKKPDEKGKELFDYIYGKQNRQFIKKEELKTKDIKI
jgi:hypothetical protein